MTIKKIKRFCGWLGLALASAVTPAQAGILSGLATIDLNSLLIETVSGDANLTFTGDSYFSQVGAGSNPPQFVSDNLTYDSQLTVHEDGGTVTSRANANLVLSSVTADRRGFGDATAQYFWNYAATGTGDVRISIPYALTVELDPTATTNPISRAFGLVELAQQNTSSVTSQGLDLFASDGSGIFDDVGFLSILLNVNPGDSGTLRFSAQAGGELIDPVPIPASFGLLFSGIAGLVAAARRRRGT